MNNGPPELEDDGYKSLEEFAAEAAASSKDGKRCPVCGCRHIIDTRVTHTTHPAVDDIRRRRVCRNCGEFMGFTRERWE